MTQTMKFLFFKIDQNNNKKSGRIKLDTVHF